MLQKLFALVSRSCAVDNPDSPQHQEVLLPGYLYGMIIKERLEEALTAIQRTIAIDVARGEGSVDFFDSEFSPSLTISSATFNFLQNDTLKRSFPAQTTISVPKWQISSPQEILSHRPVSISSKPPVSLSSRRNSTGCDTSVTSGQYTEVLSSQNSKRRPFVNCFRRLGVSCVLYTLLMVLLVVS